MAGAKDDSRDSTTPLCAVWPESRRPPSAPLPRRVPLGARGHADTRHRLQSCAGGPKCNL